VLVLLLWGRLLLLLLLLLLACTGCVLHEGADVREQLLHCQLQAAQVGAQYLCEGDKGERDGRGTGGWLWHP
jgi:hypothetical protein